MIQISLTTALILYSALLGFVALVIWTHTELATRRTQRVHEQQFLWRCIFCGYVYLDEAAERLSCCPRCESYNSVEDEHARFLKPRFIPQPVAAPSDNQPRRDASHRKRPHQRRRGPRKRG